jgi:hypothetical protein
LAPLAIESEVMTLGEIYRAKAATLTELAKSASAPKFKERFKKMALAYERLAEESAKRLQLSENKAQARRGRSRGELKIKNPKAPAATRAIDGIF